MTKFVNPIFLDDVFTGLRRPQKSIPPKWFYDQKGSEIFERITVTPEYYPTRAESQLLTALPACFLPNIDTIVEYGAGAGIKTRTLINKLDPKTYVPIEICSSFLMDTVKALQLSFPKLSIVPMAQDFKTPLLGAKPINKSLGFFSGSTIGNMLPHEAVDLLQTFALNTEYLLIGMDAIKSSDVLIPAYDDALGVTAAFNLNLLERINRELDGDIDIGGFRHEARWNEAAARIEMHLVATRAQTFEIHGTLFRILAGESIHTENSHKYSHESARMLLRTGGWEPIEHWGEDFHLILARRIEHA